MRQVYASASGPQPCPPAGTPTLPTARGQLAGGGFRKAGPLHQAALAAQARAEHQLKPHDPSPSPSAPLTPLRVCAQSSSSIRTPVSGSVLGGLSCTASGRDSGVVSPVRPGRRLSRAPHFADLVILFHLPLIFLVVEYFMVCILRLSFHPCWGVSAVLQVRAVETRSTEPWAHLSSHRQREQRCPETVLHPTSCSHLPLQPGGGGRSVLT